MAEIKPFSDNVHYPYVKCLSCIYYNDWLACFTCTFKSKFLGAKCGICGSVLVAKTRKELNLQKIAHKARACGMGFQYAVSISWRGVVNIQKIENVTTWVTWETKPDV